MLILMAKDKLDSFNEADAQKKLVAVRLHNRVALVAPDETVRTVRDVETGMDGLQLLKLGEDVAEPGLEING